MRPLSHLTATLRLTPVQLQQLAAHFYSGFELQTSFNDMPVTAREAGVPQLKWEGGELVLQLPVSMKLNYRLKLLKVPVKGQFALILPLEISDRDGLPFIRKDLLEMRWEGPPKAGWTPLRVKIPPEMQKQATEGVLAQVGEEIERQNVQIADRIKEATRGIGFEVQAVKYRLGLEAVRWEWKSDRDVAEAGVDADFLIQPERYFREKGKPLDIKRGRIAGPSKGFRLQLMWPVDANMLTGELQGQQIPLGKEGMIKIERVGLLVEEDSRIRASMDFGGSEKGEWKGLMEAALDETGTPHIHILEHELKLKNILKNIGAKLFGNKLRGILQAKINETLRSRYRQAMEEARGQVESRMEQMVDKFDRDLLHMHLQTISSDNGLLMVELLVQYEEEISPDIAVLLDQINSNKYWNTR